MNKKILVFSLIVSVVAFIITILPSHTETYVAPVKEPLATLYPALVPVCSCESEQGKYGTPQQFNKDGSVKFGKINKLDTGMCQINQKYWLAKSVELGFDIFTEQGNIKMANWIYDHNGLSPWSWSKKCWQ